MVLANLILSLIAAAVMAFSWLAAGGQTGSAFLVYAVTGQISLLSLSFRRYKKRTADA